MVCCIVNIDIENIFLMFINMDYNRNKYRNIFMTSYKKLFISLYQAAVWKALDSTFIVTPGDGIYSVLHNILITHMLSWYLYFFLTALFFSILTGLWAVHVVQQSECHIPIFNKDARNSVFSCIKMYSRCCIAASKPDSALNTLYSEQTRQFKKREGRGLEWLFKGYRKPVDTLTPKSPSWTTTFPCSHKEESSNKVKRWHFCKRIIMPDLKNGMENNAL